MRESETTRTSYRISRHRTLITALAVILVGGAAFAAVGGVEAVKKVFVKVTIRLMGPDGESYEYVQLQPFEIEDGTASTTLDIGDGNMATMVLEKIGGADDGEGAGIADGEFGTAMATITIDSASAPTGEIGTEQTIEVSMTANEGDEPVDQQDVLEQIADAEVVVPWVDASGEARELYIVRSASENETSLKVFSARWTDDRDWVYEPVGFMSGVITEGAEVTGAEVDENGLVTITVLFENGDEKRVAFNADPDDVDIRAPAIHVTVESDD